MASNGRKPERMPATLWDFSDTEILGVIDDLADENGWASAADVRMQLGDQSYNEDTGHFDGRSGVGSRLSWMSSDRADGYGWIERHPDTGLYRLTAMGHLILDNPKLSRQFESQFAKLGVGQRMALVRELAEAGHTAPREVRKALTRQWRRSLGR